MAIGGALLEGNSKLLDGPLGVVKLFFEGYDLGKTTADTNLSPDQDIKDIIYQQDGTKAADHVRTGQDIMVNATFGEISTALAVLMMAGVSSENASPSSDSMTIGRSIYQSMRDVEAGPLKIAAVDENGVASEDLEDVLNFYEAIPIIEGELINWGADTQRNLPVTFRIKYHYFADGESSTKVGAFGYMGDPTTEDVPALVWPDVQAPQLVTATATSATNLDLVFNEDIAFQSAFAAGDYIANVEGAFVAPTAGSIASTTLSLTFAAATFTAGDVIEINVGSLALQDTEVSPNTFPGLSGQAVVNNV